LSIKNSCSCSRSNENGAIIAQTSEENAKLIYEFGLNLGLAFQLQDDYLTRLVTKTLGKQVEEILLKIRRRICTLKVMSFLVKMRSQLTQVFSNGLKTIRTKLVGKEHFQ
jgi:geranylgeranyl diphosphate synthase type II